MKSRLALAALSLAASIALPAHAVGKPDMAVPVACSDSFLTLGAGYVSCQGAMVGNVAAKKNNMATFEGYGSFQYAGTVGDSSGSFLNDPSGSTDGTLDLGAAQTGLFVIGLKGGNSYSLYLFDGGSVQGGISALDFDTAGLFNGGGAGPELSHAVLFTSAATLPVPEPGSIALMLAGLGAVGLLVRRRRAV